MTELERNLIFSGKIYLPNSCVFVCVYVLARANRFFQNKGRLVHSVEGPKNWPGELISGMPVAGFSFCMNSQAGCVFLDEGAER